MCQNLLQRLGLEKYVNKRVGTYSGGTKRKLSLALALLGDPQLVLLVTTKQTGYIQTMMGDTESAKNYIFYPIEVVSRYRDPQLRLGKKYLHLYSFNQNIS